MPLFTSPGLRGLVVMLVGGALSRPCASAQPAPNPVAVALRASASTGLRITEADIARLRQEAQRYPVHQDLAVDSLQAVEARLTAAMAAYDEAGRQLTEARNQQARDAAEAARLKETIRVLTEQVGRRQQEVARLKAQILARQTEIAGIESAASAARTRLEALGAARTLLVKLVADPNIASRLIAAAQGNKSNDLRALLGTDVARIEAALVTASAMKLEFSIGALRQCIAVTPLCAGGTVFAIR